MEDDWAEKNELRPMKSLDSHMQAFDWLSVKQEVTDTTEFLFFFFAHYGQNFQIFPQKLKSLFVYKKVKISCNYLKP